MKYLRHRCKYYIIEVYCKGYFRAFFFFRGHQRSGPNNNIIYHTRRYYDFYKYRDFRIDRPKREKKKRRRPSKARKYLYK